MAGRVSQSARARAAGTEGTHCHTTYRWIDEGWHVRCRYADGNALMVWITSDDAISTPREKKLMVPSPDEKSQVMFCFNDPLPPIEVVIRTYEAARRLCADRDGHAEADREGGAHGGAGAMSDDQILEQIRELWTKLNPRSRGEHLHWTLSMCATCGRKGTWEGPPGCIGGIWCDACCDEGLRLMDRQ